MEKIKALFKNKIFLASLGVLIAVGTGAKLFMGKSKTAHHSPETAEDLFAQTKAKLANKHGADHGDAKEHGKKEEGHAADSHQAEVSHGLAPIHAFKSALSKVDDLAQMDVENRRLRIENMNLREWSEALAYDCRAIHAEKKTADVEMKLAGRTGALVGRLLEAVDYRPPHGKSGVELYTLGASYFKDQDFERAAVIFAYLIRTKRYKRFRTPENYLTTGVALYKIDHYALADLQFNEVLSFKETDKMTKHYQAQARLWRGLAADRTDKYRNSQRWLKELIDHHPHSIEAAWINGENIERLPGSTFDPASIRPLNEEEIYENDENEAAKGGHDASEAKH